MSDFNLDLQNDVRDALNTQTLIHRSVNAAPTPELFRGSLPFPRP